jgi:hypothetical protein
MDFTGAGVSTLSSSDVSRSSSASYGTGARVSVCGTPVYGLDSAVACSEEATSISGFWWFTHLKMEDWLSFIDFGGSTEEQVMMKPSIWDDQQI